MRIRMIGVLVGVVVLAGCAGNSDTDAGVVTLSVTSSPAAPAAGAPVTSRLPAPVGRIVVEARTRSGKPVAGTAVTARRAAQCDSARRDIPPGTAYLDTFTGTVGAGGSIVFGGVPLGCYSASMTPPTGSNPVPEGMHSAFLTTGSPNVTITFRFNDSPASTPGACTAAAIAADLDLPQAQKSAAAKVAYCKGDWAVISWNVPGDSQRLVQHRGAAWTTYVSFPHNQCWSEAKRNGVPADLVKYFGKC
ncbi:MAG: hypothetical protein HOQ24_07950 [Mycobacteriaceae bacterium]|nr:hypothetical protein [Mycobacteriaceae bacterium]